MTSGIPGITCGNYNTLLSNNVFLNNGLNTDGGGVDMANDDLSVSNNIYSNCSGVFFNGSANNTLISDSIYGAITCGANDSALAMDNTSNTGNVCVGCILGYTRSGYSAPDASNEVGLGVNTSNVTFKSSLINPAIGIINSNSFSSTKYILIYSTSPSVVQVYGDYQLSGSTLTLDYANQLYSSTATIPVVMSGAESASGFAVNSTSDTYAVSQLVTLVYNSGSSQWVVTGSSSGLICSMAVGTANCGSPVQI